MTSRGVVAMPVMDPASAPAQSHERYMVCGHVSVICSHKLLLYSLWTVVKTGIKTPVQQQKDTRRYCDQARPLVMSSKTPHTHRTGYAATPTGCKFCFAYTGSR